MELNRRWLAVGSVVAVVVVAAAARVSVDLPGTPVPQSLQTLAVVLAGVFLGSRWGAVALAGYVAAGALGLPVFADGGGGFAHLVGPTGGYLAGFVVGAWLVGWWTERGWNVAVASAVAGAFAAHVVILGLGWLRLATLVGGAAAWSGGVQPFLVGGAVKSALAAVPAAWWGRRLKGARGGTNLSGLEAKDAPKVKGL